MVNPARILISPLLKRIRLRILLGISLILIITGCGPLATPQAGTLATTSLPSPTVSKDCAAGIHINQLTSGGQTRQYRLYIPQSYQAGTPAALVFGFHGNNGQADWFEGTSRLSPLADRENFIAVYPQGAGEHPTWETWEGSKDVQFIRDLIDRLEILCSIDPARIYATGLSLGGGMANRLACDLSDRIAAIGPVAGAYLNADLCSPSRPVPVMAVHGTADSIIFYNGFPPGGNSPGAYFTVGVPIPQWASAWAQRNGCNARSSIVFREDPVSGQQWGNCRAGADVLLYTIRDGEHNWATPAAEFNVEQSIWDFFSRHPLVPGAGG